MTLLHRLASVMRWVLRRNHAEHELHEELRTFLDISTAEKVREGVPLAEALRQAVIELGGLEQVKERVRTARHGAWVDEVPLTVGAALLTLMSAALIAAFVPARRASRVDPLTALRYE